MNARHSLKVQASVAAKDGSKVPIDGSKSCLVLSRFVALCTVRMITGFAQIPGIEQFRILRSAMRDAAITQAVQARSLANPPHQSRSPSN